MTKKLVIVILLLLVAGHPKVREQLVRILTRTTGTWVGTVR